MDNPSRIEKIDIQNDNLAMININTTPLSDTIQNKANFDRFYLTENAELFIYDEDRTFYLGALTHDNNKHNKQVINSYNWAMLHQMNSHFCFA